MPGLAFRFFGPFQASRNGESLTRFRTVKAQALLIYLVAEPRVAHSRESLMTLLWPDLSPEPAQTNLRQIIYQLRKTIPEVESRDGDGRAPFLLSERRTVQVYPAAVYDADVAAFDALMGAVRAHEHGDLSGCPFCRSRLEQAVTLYQGPFLADFFLGDSNEFENWAERRREAYRRQAMDALAALAEAQLRWGDNAQAQVYARRQLAVDDLDERAVRQLMEALARDGRRNEALSVFDETRRLLREELGMTPSTQTTRLAQQIKADDLKDATPAPASQQEPFVAQSGAAVAAKRKTGAGQVVVNLPPWPKTNLPADATPFVGRTAELAELERLLSDPVVRMVTVRGPGGIGKTRLALAAARAALRAGRFPDGAFFIPLAPLTSVEQMMSTVASVIGLQFAQSEIEPRRQLADYLRRRSALLLFDNYEHLLNAGGAVLPAEILAAAPGMCILATSRTRPGVQGEHVFSVAGMRLPRPDDVATWQEPEAEMMRFSALRLFRNAAARVRPDFRLSRDNVADVAAICRLVEGMPLGIELAAAWLEMLSTREIAAELLHNPDLLASDLPGVVDRQRSIRAVFDASWRLLSDRERTLLPELSIFRSGFSGRAAEAVAGTALRDLAGLVNKSWLQRTPGGEEGSRFQMHELLRRYAEEKLRADGQSETAARERFAGYYAALLDENRPRLLGGQQKQALALLSAEFDHIRIAWKWLIERGEFERLTTQMLHSLQRFSYMRGLRREGSELVERAIDACRRSTGRCPDRALAALLIARSSLRHGDSDPSKLWEEVWRLASGLEEPEDALGYWYIFLLGARRFGDPEAVRTLHRLAQMENQLAGDAATALACRLIGISLMESGDDPAALDEAAAWLERAADVCERTGDQWACAFVYQNLAEAHSLSGNHEQARALLDQAQTIFESLDSWQNAAWLFHIRADHALRRGRPDLFFQGMEAQALYARDKGDRIMELFALSWESLHALRYSTVDHALRLREQSLAMARELEYAGHEAWDWWELGEIYRVAGSPVEALRCYELARVWFQSQSHGFGLACYERGRGDLALSAGDFAAAAGRFGAGYELLRAVPHEPWSHVYALIGLTRAFIGLGDLDEALGHLRGALRIARKPVLHDIRLLIPAAVGELMLAADRCEPAAVMCGLVAAHPLSWNETRARMQSVAAQARAALGDAAAGAIEARGRDVDARRLIAGLAALPESDLDDWLEEAAQLIAGLPVVS